MVRTCGITWHHDPSGICREGASRIPRQTADKLCISSSQTSSCARTQRRGRIACQSAITHSHTSSVRVMKIAANLIATSHPILRVCCLHRLLPARRLICRAQHDSQDSRQRRPNQADALTQSLSSVSNKTGRIAQTRNFVLGTDNSEASWRALDEQVCSRHFSIAAILLCIEMTFMDHLDSISCR